MTSAQQKRFYGPAWNDAFKACWRRDRGTILPQSDRPSAHPESGIPRPEDVEDIAGRIVGSRAVTDSDLRRACRYLALGRDIPNGGDLNNTDELDRVVILFRLLKDPDDVEAVQIWLNPGISARTRIIRGIESLNVQERQLRAWCHHFNEDHGYDWRSLPDERLAAFNGYVWKECGPRRRKKQKEAA